MFAQVGELVKENLGFTLINFFVIWFWILKLGEICYCIIIIMLILSKRVLIIEFICMHLLKIYTIFARISRLVTSHLVHVNKYWWLKKLDLNHDSKDNNMFKLHEYVLGVYVHLLIFAVTRSHIEGP